MASIEDTNRLKFYMRHSELRSDPQFKTHGAAETTYNIFKTATSLDIIATAGHKTEQTPTGEIVPSSIIISELCQHILREDPLFIQKVLGGDFSLIHQGRVLVGSFATVKLISINFKGRDLVLAVKIHGEGDSAYPHWRDGLGTDVVPDRVSAIDNFLALRAIGLSGKLVVPPPIFATQRVFVSPFIEAKPLSRSQVPEWVKVETKKWLGYAYSWGWLQYPYRLFGILPKSHTVDLKTLGNVLLTKDGQFCIVDPIY